MIDADVIGEAWLVLNMFLKLGALMCTEYADL